jgi:hypothetical protein
VAQGPGYSLCFISSVLFSGPLTSKPTREKGGHPQKGGKGAEKQTKGCSSDIRKRENNSMSQRSRVMNSITQIE